MSLIRQTLSLSAGDRRIGASILRMAGPVALGRLGVMSMGLADTIMVGQMAPDQLAWQALGWAPTAVFLVAAIGLLAGVQVLTARVMGEGAREASGAVWRRGLVLALASGVAAAALLWVFGEQGLLALGVARELSEPSADVMRILALSLPFHLIYVASAFYLEALRRPLAATVIMWVANVVNLGLNALLIPSFGAEGSAWATVGARLFLAAALVVWILRLRDARALGVLGGATAPGVSFRALLGVGVAAAVSQAVEAGAFSAMTVIAGRIGERAVASYAVLLNILSLVFMVAMGLATATAVQVSEALGAKNRVEAARAAWIGLGLNTAAMLAAAAALLTAPELIARAFSADPVIAAMVAAQMLWAALILPPDGGQVVAASALRARGDNWAPTANHVLAYAIVMPPLGFYLAEVQKMGVSGLMAAIFVASMVSVLVLIARQYMLHRSS
ncbi:MAG: MATE family efflux transporter [Alphaproteobacteria bacterium]|nr:MATE family efflux transporter [Alphaproteobacteria bacterium]